VKRVQTGALNNQGIQMAKNKKIEVEGREITLYTNKSDDYISLTDMARYRDAQRTN